MAAYSGDFPIRVHPGEVLREMLEERELAQSELARHLRIDSSSISEICRGRRGISAAMSVMLARAFGTSAELWMNLQKNWELSQVDRRAVAHIRPLRRSA